MILSYCPNCGCSHAVMQGVCVVCGSALVVLPKNSKTAQNAKKPCCSGCAQELIFSPESVELTAFWFCMRCFTASDTNESLKAVSCPMCANSENAVCDFCNRLGFVPEANWYGILTSYHHE